MLRSYCLLGFTLVNLCLLNSASYIGDGLAHISSQEFDDFCPEGEYENEAGDCVTCTSCEEGEGEDYPCGHFHDRVCEACRLSSTYSVQLADTRNCFPCTRCQNMEIKQQCTLTNNTVCGECLPGYFFDELTHDCRRCSFCDPDHPEEAVRIQACNTQPRDFQCYPASTSPFLSDYDMDGVDLPVAVDFTTLEDPMDLMDPVEFETTTRTAQEVDEELLMEVRRMADEAEKNYHERNEQNTARGFDIENLAVETDAFLRQSRQDAEAEGNEALIVALQNELSARLSTDHILVVGVATLLAFSLILSIFTLCVVMRMRKSLSRDSYRIAPPIYRPFQAMLGGGSKISAQLLSPDPTEFS